MQKIAAAAQPDSRRSVSKDAAQEFFRAARIGIFVAQAKNAGTFNSRTFSVATRCW
jgi:hypothetical protein